MASSGRVPSRRAVAAAVKLCGRRLERRWPYFVRPDEAGLNLGYEDLLEFQYARSRDFTVLVVGAFDGLANDPASDFVRRNRCRAIFVEPQPGAFGRLKNNLGGVRNVAMLNVAIGEVSGYQDMYYVPGGSAGLPAWTEQLASFSLDHVLKHKERAPDLPKHIRKMQVPTLSFADLFEQQRLSKLDVLQIDAEGMDALLLQWFPFERMKPALLHYEVAHMSVEQRGEVRNRLNAFGYVALDDPSSEDAMALRFQTIASTEWV